MRSFYVSQVGFKLTMLPKLALNSLPSSCLSLFSVKVMLYAFMSGFYLLSNFSLSKAGEIPQLARCLPFKHKDLSFIPRTQVKMPIVVTSLGRPRQEEPWGLLTRQSSLIVE